MNILITGGCGFVGSSLAKLFKLNGSKVTAIDNLKRKGSEFNLQAFKDLSINFIHADLRNTGDLNGINECFDLIIDAAAEPSVCSDINNLSYVLDTNLNGTINILNFAIKKSASMIFLSTSRVYEIEALKKIPIIENNTRFEIDKTAKLPNGLSDKGISENFNILNSYRSLYGTTKLCSELIIQEYARLFKYPIVINRCGVLSGSGQFGKTDQGVFSLFVAKHMLNQDITYKGFNGTGKQVRDILHPNDLHALIIKQFFNYQSWNADIYCVGGGYNNSTSLYEFCQSCESIIGNNVGVHKDTITSNIDIPYYVSDYTKVKNRFDWEPKISIKEIITDIYLWLNNDIKLLKYIFN